MGNKVLMRLEATSNKEIMEKYGCKRQEIGDQVMEEFRPLVPSRLDDHQPVEFCDESTGRPLFTIYPAIGKGIFENGKILYKTLTGDFLFSIIGY